MVSTKGCLMIDIAEHGNGAYIPLKEVSERQTISLKYLEKILPVLTKNGLIDTATAKTAATG